MVVLAISSGRKGAVECGLPKNGEGLEVMDGKGLVVVGGGQQGVGGGRG